MSRLDLKGLGRHFEHAEAPAVEDVTFSVEDGSIAALVGESGAGKSTLLRLIAGLDQPDTGAIQLGPRVISTPRLLIPPEQRGVGFVFQNHALFPHLSVAENIAFGLPGLARGERTAEVERLLALVRLPGRAASMPHELSGGERQRVALARTLAPRPGLLLLDEPFSSLDVALRAEMRAEIGAILRRLRLTVLVVTHDADDALSLADRITVIRGGRI
jgi:iron(III) transport system ATP-binding protein